MTVNNLPGQPPVCYCGGAHRSADHREVERAFLAKCDAVLASHGIQASRAHLVMGLATQTLGRVR